MGTAYVSPVITAAELAARLRDGDAPLMIDVREPDEFAAGRIPGSQNMPLSRFAVQFRSLPADREIALICRSGNRSGVAQQFLRQHGYQVTRNLIQGMLGWNAAVESDRQVS